MNKLAIASAVAVALSSIAAAPAVAQDTVAVPYGDLDLTTTAGAQALGERLEAGVKAVCDRPTSATSSRWRRGSSARTLR